MLEEVISGPVAVLLGRDRNRWNTSSSEQEMEDRMGIEGGTLIPSGEGSCQ